MTRYAEAQSGIAGGGAVLRRSRERGLTRMDWLESRHSFSFGDYFDRAWMGFGPLRVINDDIITPGAGFAMHPHRDMEIISWVVSGALEHRDSLGNGSILRPGDVQVMSAGKGIVHSEWNPSAAEAGRFLQIWIQPRRRGGAPRYEGQSVEVSEMAGSLRPIVSGNGLRGTLAIDADVVIAVATAPEEAIVRHEVKSGRGAWLQVVEGRVEVSCGAEFRLESGDGLAVTYPGELVMKLNAGSEVMLFDLEP